MMCLLVLGRARYKTFFYHRGTESTEVFIVCALHKQYLQAFLCVLCASVVNNNL
jgi:hypothetical protein